MAYDRPSPKFLSFLDKHYDLKNSVPQVGSTSISVTILNSVCLISERETVIRLSTVLQTSVHTESETT